MSIFGTPVFSSGGARFSPTATAIANTAIGDVLLIGVGWSDSGTVSVVDSAGNTYTPGIVHLGGSHQNFQWWYCLGATHASATNTVTATFSNTTNNNTILSVRDIPCSGTAEFDVDVASDGGNDATTASYSTAGIDEFVAVDAYDQSGTGGYEAEAGYTLDSDSFATFGGAEHTLFDSAQTDITSTFASHPSGSSAFALGLQAGTAPPPAIGGSKQNIFTTEVFGAEMIPSKGIIFGTSTRTHITK